MPEKVSITSNIFRSLLVFSATHPVARHLAYLVAGWLTLFGLKPKLAPTPPLSTMALVLAAVIVVLMLVSAGPVLNLVQPAFRIAGTLSAFELAAFFAVVLNCWRYLAGKKVLKAFSDFQAQG